VASDDKWVVHLGDGTWVELDELPTVVLLTKDQLEEIEDLEDFPLDCKPFTHIHIKDLVEQSHWADHVRVDKAVGSHDTGDLHPRQ